MFVVSKSLRVLALLVSKHIEAQRHTRYDACMTMFTFRVSDDEAAATQLWADRLGVDRSAFLREALHRHLVLLRGAGDAERWTDEPLTADETALESIANWGPAEDWSDWAHA